MLRKLPITGSPSAQPESVSFVGGAMAEYFHQRRTKPLRVFLISLSIFSVLAAIIFPLSGLSESYITGSLFLDVAGIGLFLALLMVIMLYICKSKAKAPQSD
jgi:hypothetical protein